MGRRHASRTRSQALGSGGGPGYKICPDPVGGVADTWLQESDPPCPGSAAGGSGFAEVTAPRWANHPGRLPARPAAGTKHAGPLTFEPRTANGSTRALRTWGPGCALNHGRLWVGYGLPPWLGGDSQQPQVWEEGPARLDLRPPWRRGLRCALRPARGEPRGFLPGPRGWAGRKAGRARQGAQEGSGLQLQWPFLLFLLGKRTGRPVTQEGRPVGGPPCGAWGTLPESDTRLVGNRAFRSWPQVPDSKGSRHSPLLGRSPPHPGLGKGPAAVPTSLGP